MTTQRTTESPSETNPEGSERDALNDLADQQGRRLGFHSTMHNHACAALLGIHPTDWELLDLLCWAGPLTAGHVARHLGMSNAGATAVIDRLEHHGFVYRTRDTEDRRQVVVHLDRTRDADIEATFTTLRAAMEANNARFTTDELRTIIEFMRGASAALEESTARIRGG